MSTKTYKPSSIVIAISHSATNTSHVLGGMTKDSVVTIEYPDATWTNKTDNEGSRIRVHSADKNINMTVHIDQTSPSNDYLEALADFDEIDPTGLDGIFTLTFADKSSRAFAYSSDCTLSRPQNYEYGSDTSARDWVISMGDPQKSFGGSGKLDQDLVTALQAFGIEIEDRWKK